MKKKLIVIILSIALIAVFVVIIGQGYGNNEENVFIKSQSKSASVIECKNQENNTEVTVYITKTGKKYHLGNCRYLKKSKIKISLKEACERGYTPCKVCKPPECP